MVLQPVYVVVSGILSKDDEANRSVLTRAAPWLLILPWWINVFG